MKRTFDANEVVNKYFIWPGSWSNMICMSKYRVPGIMGDNYMTAGAMPSVVKVSAEVPPRASREVDRLSRNPENGWRT